MPYVNFVSDEFLIETIQATIKKIKRKIGEVNKEFDASVIDPFSTLFEVSFLDIESIDDWIEKEKYRQIQKIIPMQLGAMHQKILGEVEGWVDEKVGSRSGVDVINRERKILAEIKNKYNTVKKSDEIHYFKALKNLVGFNHSIYPDFLAYYVTIIPENPNRFNLPFTPSDKDIADQLEGNKKAKKKVAEHPRIKIIDGASFYHLVTGEENALQNLILAMSNIIRDEFESDYSEDKSDFVMKLFSDAFI